MDRRALLVEEQLDHGLSDRVRTDADSIDIVVGQIDRLARGVRATVITCDDVNQVVDSELGCSIVALERRSNEIRRRKCAKRAARGRQRELNPA